LDRIFSGILKYFRVKDRMIISEVDEPERRKVKTKV
jgi:hypothetical protein